MIPKMSITYHHERGAGGMEGIYEKAVCTNLQEGYSMFTKFLVSMEDWNLYQIFTYGTDIYIMDGPNKIDLTGSIIMKMYKKNKCLCTCRSVNVIINDTIDDNTIEDNKNGLGSSHESGDSSESDQSGDTDRPDEDEDIDEDDETLLLQDLAYLTSARANIYKNLITLTALEYDDHDSDIVPDRIELSFSDKDQGLTFCT
jgi:hypothetical protein